LSILITLFGEIIVLIALRCAIESVDGIIFQKVALFIFGVYLIGIFTVTLGNRTADNVGNINIVLFSTIKHMFSPTANYIKQKGLLRGLRALKWIGYPAWESIVFNFLMLVPLGYLTPCCFRCIKRDFRLQKGNLAYKTGISFTKWDSWSTNGTLGLLFTPSGILSYKIIAFVSHPHYN